MNKAHALLFALMMMTVSLAGCFGGDDGDSNDEISSETLDDWQVHFAASSSDLPECNDDTNGRLYYVEADGEFQVCTTSGWEVIEISGANGVIGLTGEQGSTGADGVNGVNGQDGTSILINVVNSTSCTTGGNTFEIGSDSNSDAVLDASEVGITVDICNGSQGPEGPQGPAGDAGMNGTNALNALVSSSPETSGNNCANGGIRIDVGVDDNADGVLDTTEIDQTQYVCNGGSSNNTMLTSISSPLSNMGCDAGGRTVSYGLDNGDGGGTYANGVLEPGEVDASTTLCSRYSTVLFRDINTGSGNGYFEPFLGQTTRSLIAVGNTLFMAANDGTNGFELWKSDGTASGTMMVKDINNGSGGSYPTDFTAIGNTLYFRANDGTNGYELWKSDGTPNGTMMVKDINNGSGGSYPYYLTAVGNTLYFEADDGTNGYELWKSDGTASGTVMVKDINNGSGGSYPSSLTAIGTTLYFSADDGTNGGELWKSDGTANGTMMVKDINIGSDPSICQFFTAVGNTLYFQADDGYNGVELWKSDGTASGTVLDKDIRYGSGSSNPNDFAFIGNTLYFTADDGYTGIELYSNTGLDTEVIYS